MNEKEEKNVEVGPKYESTNLLSELRSSEAEIKLRKTLEERLRNTNHQRSQTEIEETSSKKLTKSVVVKSVVTFPVVQSAKSPIRKLISFPQESNRRLEPLCSPSTSYKGLCSTVNVVRNASKERNNSHDFRSNSRQRSSSRERSTVSNRSKGRNYTGYNYRDDRNVSPEQDHLIAVSRPSPPKDMPEHIRWLHDRWSRYDGSFFTGAHSKPAPVLQQSTHTRDMEDYKRIRSDTKRSQSVVSSGPNKRKWEETDPSGSKKSNDQQSYFEWRYGGTSYEQVGQMLTFKEFLISYPSDIEEQERAVSLYNEYKVDYKKRAFQEFFKLHQDEEWFMEKYNPIFKAKVLNRRNEIIRRRLVIFMNLLVRGWLETNVDYTESRHVRKLLDAACVLLEGGSETDIESLSDFDYVLEEKREQSYDVERLLRAAEENEKEEEFNEIEKNKGADTVSAKRDKISNDSDGELNDDDNDEKEKKQEEAMKLEVMQHARDYTLYVEQHTKTFEGITQDVCDMPDTISSTKTETKYIGEGVFVSHITNSKNLAETSLHKSAALCLRNIDPNITRLELEDICADAHGGFTRIHLSVPDPRNNWCRHGVASFWLNANLMKICWVLRGRKLRGKPLMVIEYRDFKKRIELVDGLAADKSVVLRDIQLCKSLIEHLDKRHGLWSNEDEGETYSSDSSTTGPKVNPLLVNLDECLAFHLQELIKSGKINDSGLLDGSEKRKTGGAKVDRDENLTRILDRLILYLRIVHSIDYYGCAFFETEDDEPKRIATIHLRGPASRTASPKALAAYIKDFEENLKTLLPSEARLADEHVELLGKKTLDVETEKFIADNIVSVADGMAKCCVCFKRFTSRNFARSHFNEKHEDKLEEIKFVVSTYNNYLSDPNRPCHIEFL